MKTFNEFKNLYQLSKTLRFELKPIGKTLDFIQEKGLLAQDEERADSYKKVKRVIDEYHKKFIDERLANTSLIGIDEFDSMYFILNKDDKEKKELEAIQKSLRKQISERFTKTDDFKRLFGKELIKEDLATIVDDESVLKDIGEFKNFTTYFTGFHENRKNMYSSDEKSTAIAYRLIHENLPKFLGNVRLFRKISKDHPKIIEQAKVAIEPHLFGIELENIFENSFFNQVLRQSDIDIYNLMLGGKADENSKIQGLNEIINVYRQQNGLSKRDIPNLSVLYKQILSDRESFSVVLEKFDKPQQLLDSINGFYKDELINWKDCDNQQNVFQKLQGILSDNSIYDKSQIFIKNDSTLTDLSQQLFGSWSIIGNALKLDFYISNPKLKPSEANDDKIAKIKYFSISQIERALENYCQDIDDLKDKFKSNLIFDYFSVFKKRDSGLSLLDLIEQHYANAEDLLSSVYPDHKSLISDDDAIAKIKDLLDSLMDVIHFIKPLRAVGYEGEKDAAFYPEFLYFAEQLDKLTPLYNKVRNYLTQKPYSVEKFKLNFESSYLLSGWIPNYDTKAGLLYELDGNFYLAINDKKLKKEEIDYLTQINGTKTAQRIVLDFQKPDNTNTPRMFIRSKGTNFAPAVAEFNLPVETIIDIYDSGKFKTEYRKLNPEDYKQCLAKLIDYFKLGFSKHNSYKHFDFQWKQSNDYNDIAEFYHDTIASCYGIKYEETNWEHLMEYVNQGKLYLFQIYNKDFSEFSKGRPNLHTMYWRSLFSPENLKDVVYKLNGQAEIFFRKKSLNYSEEILKRGHHAEKLKDKFDYPIISKKRFAFDKFQFHVPITMNFKANGKDNINQPVLEYLKQTPANEINFIGIDRGERHLLYLSMINAKGEIIQQFTLNDIVNEYNNQKHPTDYHELLTKKEKKRADSRTQWKTIETIKELKEGYVSQVVHIVSKMMVENKAVLLMEDLNFGFKRGRFKVEKQVYQKFEKMLIDKLNYYVDKTKAESELGGVLNAMQLASKFTSFKDLGKQSGFIFYVPAWNTSKIDPVTGFVNLFFTKYENLGKSIEFFGKFTDIRWNRYQKYFEFQVDNYSSFNSKAEGTRQNWVICTHGTRLENFRNEKQNNRWDTREVNLSEKLSELFNSFKINKENNLKNQILAQTDKKFFESLYYYFKLTLQMRNSRTGTEEDYLISPVANENDEFFDSRLYANLENAKLPKDADANGAYNIARKGLLLLNKIKKCDVSKKVDLKQSNREWLNFAQQ